MNRILAIVAVVLVAGLGGLWWMSGQGAAPGLDLPAAANAQGSDVDTSGVVEMTLGAPDAPVTVIEYASFTCPHCANFHTGNFKKLKADYIDTGKINFVYREVYFDKYGLWAGMMARCGEGTSRYFPLTEVLYAQQRDWLGADSDRAIAGNLIKIGKTAGLTEDQLNACLGDQDMAQALVASYQENATADGVRSTPSFVINGTLYANMPWEDFEKALIEAGVE